MGQYHMVIKCPKALRDTKYYVNPLDCLTITPTGVTQGGCKFPEHSHRGSEYVRVVESLLREGGDWFKAPIVWAGDNADGGTYGIREEDGSVRGVNLYEM